MKNTIFRTLKKVTYLYVCRSFELVVQFLLLLLTVNFPYSFTEISKITPSTSDVIVLREQTTSSSSDSIFTDPLTPVGFAAEINQCYYSEENVCDEKDADDSEHLSELTKAAIAARNYPRTSQSTQTKVEKLTISSIDKFNIVNWEERDASVVISSSWSPDTDTMPLTSLRNKISPLIIGGGTSDNGNLQQSITTTPTSVFNVARIKKIELQDLSMLKGLDSPDGKYKLQHNYILYFCLTKYACVLVL